MNLFRTRSLILALLAALTLALPLAHAADEPPKKNFFLRKSPRAAAYVLSRLSNKESIEALKVFDERPPSPRPSPPGEDESCSALGRYRRAQWSAVSSSPGQRSGGCNGGREFSLCRRSALPLPGGEGEPSAALGRCGYARWSEVRWAEAQSGDGQSGQSSFPATQPGSPSPLGERAGVRASVPLTFFPLRRQGLGVRRQRPRRASLQFTEDRVPIHLSLAPETRVPEPQHLDAKRSEELLPLRVMFPLFWKSVLASIQFNRQPRLFAEKIERVFADRMLSAEFVTAESSPAQPAPHELFCPGRLLPENASQVGVGHGRHDSDVAPMKKNGVNARPHPGPLPQERVNHPPLSDDTDAHSGPPSRPAQAKEAAIATVGENFPCDAAAFSLSPGERAGVRGSVNSDFTSAPLSPSHLYSKRNRNLLARIRNRTADAGRSPH